MHPLCWEIPSLSCEDLIAGFFMFVDSYLALRFAFHSVILACLIKSFRSGLAYALTAWSLLGMLQSSCGSNLSWALHIDVRLDKWHWMSRYCLWAICFLQVYSAQITLCAGCHWALACWLSCHIFCRYVRVYDKLQLQPEYEINPDELQLVEKVGEGEFGSVHRGTWNKTTVAIKVLRRSDAVALGDFRWPFKYSCRVIWPFST